MPELPEVETIARSLKFGGVTGESIINRTILSAELCWQRTLASSGQDCIFEDWLTGKTVTDVSRRGKFLLLSIPPKTLLIHLRMSGDLRLVPSSDESRRPHDRFFLHFLDNTSLAFNDTRKFGRIWLTDDPTEILGELGVEPLSENFSADWLAERLRGSSRMIKPLLMDQKVIAGIGNIYADEALFRAGIFPGRKANTLTNAETAMLVESIRAVLEDGIRANGASIDWVYRGGDFQNHFRAYQQTGKPCPVCGSGIRKITLAQRGTHFCPKCQPRD